MSLHTPELQLEGTSPEMLRRQIRWSEQGLHAADCALRAARQVVSACESRVRTWTTSIDQLRAELRKLGQEA